MSLCTRKSPVVSGAMIVAFLAMSVAGVAHHAVERHERCAEHGELIHVEVAGQTVVVEESARPTIERGDVQQEDSHDHCDIAMASRDKASTHSGEMPGCADLEDHSASPAVASFVTPTATLYRLAPKTSPPA